MEAEKKLLFLTLVKEHYVLFWKDITLHRETEWYGHWG